MTEYGYTHLDEARWVYFIFIFIFIFIFLHGL